jgi:hypothetical protein
MRKVAILLALVLALPTAALAAQSERGKSAPQVLLVLKGTVSSYAAGGETPGSVSVTVAGSNRFGKALKGDILTFAVDSKTKVSVAEGGSLAAGDKAIVKVRIAKPTLGAILTAALTGKAALQIVEQSS